MDSKTEALIRELATKLGTTVDHLWSVMIKQAFVSSMISIFQYLLIIAGVIVWVKIHKWLSEKEGDGYSNMRYDDYELAAGVPMIITGIMLLILVVVSLFSITDTITGFVNPEYWALDHIINHH